MLMQANNNVTFEIEELGPVRNSSFRLKPFMVFSGESGVGKSYTTLLVHYFYVLLTKERLSRFFDEINITFDKFLPNDEDTEPELTINVADLSRWINKDIIDYLRDMLGNSELNGKVGIKIPFPDKRLNFSIKKEIIQSENDQNRTYLSVSLNNQSPIQLPMHRNWGNIVLVFLLRIYLRKISLGTNIVDQSFILPPSRGGFMGMTTIKKFDAISRIGMYREFLEDMDNTGYYSAYRNKPSKKIISLLNNVSKGKIFTANDEVFYATDNVKIPITAAASSIKELSPLALLLSKNPINRYSVLFEEPEAHLHPAMQLQLTELLICMVNEGAHLQITTHSDYVIRRINDSINLSILSQKVSPNKFKSTCKKLDYDKDLVLDPNLVASYFMSKDADGFVKVIQQDTDGPIPYDSFKRIIDNNMVNSMRLAEIIESEKW